MLEPADALPVTEQHASRVICVLGMHRSGTSCLAGTLEQAGVFLGEVATQNKFNVKGNRENAAVRTVNGQVLHDNGGDWNRPPVGRVAWNDEHRNARDAVIRSYAGHPVWGFKDPRALLTLDGWLEALPRLEFVGVVRHPLAVARSLRSRPRGPELVEGIRLWATYNTRLLEYRERYDFPMVSFDAPAEKLTASLCEVTQRLKLPQPSIDGAMPFFDPDLKHQSVSADGDTDATSLDDKTGSLYERLLHLAL